MGSVMVHYREDHMNTEDLVTSVAELRVVPVGTLLDTPDGAMWRILPACIEDLSHEGTFEINDLNDDDEYFPLIVRYIPQY
jgi:hypothetical protein